MRSKTNQAHLPSSSRRRLGWLAVPLALVLASAACEETTSAEADLGAPDALGDTGGEPPPPPPDKREWYQFGHSDYILDQVTLHYLGMAWHQSADVGEVLETASRVDGEDSDSWAREFKKTAERMVALAEASEAKGHELSASHAYLRAATYYRATLHRYMDPYAPEVRGLTDLEVKYFEKYLELSGSPCETVDIPYEATTLPGYFCPSPLAEGPAPTILFHEGKDAWAEDGKFVVDEAAKRGYHVLLFDGPGIGKVLRRQELPFRHDWEAVITPVVDFVLARDDVDPDRVGLMALSMGGFLGARAAAFEHRLKVLILNPGVLDWSVVYTGFIAQLDPSLLDLLANEPATFDATLEAYMQVNDFLRWGFIDSQWHLGTETPSQFMTEIMKYKLDGLEKQITAHTLIIDAEAEEWGQSLAFYDSLESPKDYILFEATEAAQFHCQPGATAIAAHRIFDWLDESI